MKPISIRHVGMECLCVCVAAAGRLMQEVPFFLSISYFLVVVFLEANQVKKKQKRTRIKKKRDTIARDI